MAPTTPPNSGFVTLQHAICRLLYLLCKVRGEKIIIGFLNNEPRYLEPILLAFEKSTKPVSEDDQESTALIATWEERYVLLLWLSHLLLAPFDLASISSENIPVDSSASVTLPEKTPSIAAHIVPMCIRHLESPSKERDSAALLLVRLCLRPDMREIGLLNSVVDWALARSRAASAQDLEIHQYLGILSFLSRLVVSANTDEIGSFIPGIYRTCQIIIDSTEFASIRASAIVRKFVVKIFRNLIVLCLQWEFPIADTTSMLEEVIEYLLGTLADTDTPVRYAASKALSVITLKLDPEMAAEVVEAVLGSFGENVLWEGTTRNLSSVDPLKWHGLALTLGYVLYRRIPSTDQLPEVLNALLLALSFEQRSTTSATIGTNVRDAACFGIWALSRRYKTNELAEVDTATVRSLAQHDKVIGVTQMLAIELLIAACLDPAGNIRRGSSAALQELIGRHPNTVAEGISLVQTVDYHAVSLRGKAIEDVGFSAAKHHDLYWNALLQEAMGWRGLGAVDAASRQSAASLIGHLTTLRSFETVREITSGILKKLEALPMREIEDRHGLMFCLTSVIKYCRLPQETQLDAAFQSDPIRSREELDELFPLWAALVDKFGLHTTHFTTITLRPELTALATCAFIAELSQATALSRNWSANIKNELPFERILEYLKLCMRRTEESVLNSVHNAVSHFTRLLDETDRKRIADEWLHILVNSPGAASRPAGLMLSLGALTVNLKPGDPVQMTILQALCARCTTEFPVEVRVVALQSLQQHLELNVLDSGISSSSLEDMIRERNQQIGVTLFTALNDYTITERGDVGSLVRLEALNTVQKAWDKGLFLSANEFNLHATVVRLALEKLDKVRTRAANVFSHTSTLAAVSPVSTLDASSYEYFKRLLTVFATCPEEWLRTAILGGFTSSAGLGSETVVQASRQALVDLVYEDESGNTIRIVCQGLLELFSLNLGNDRIVLPLLEVVAFLFDAGIVTDPRNIDFKYVQSKFGDIF